MLDYSMHLCGQSGSLQPHADTVVLLLRTIYKRVTRCPVEDRGHVDYKYLASLYDDAALYVLSVLFQYPKLRHQTTAVLARFPFIPSACLRFLRLLMLNGSKTGSTAEASSGDHQLKYRSVRAEALSVLLNLTVLPKRDTALQALNILLWSCLSEDFEVRSRVIASLTR